MYSSKVIQNIIFPVTKENIYPCRRYFCRCIEYLNFEKKKDVLYYKNCMINDFKNDEKSNHPIYTFEQKKSNIYLR